MEGSLFCSLSSVCALRNLVVAAGLLVSAAAFAHETPPPRCQRNGEIYFDVTPVDNEDFGGAPGASHCIQRNRFAEFRGMNRRTVGNGWIGQTVDANGVLLNPETLAEDGLLARKAFIRVGPSAESGRRQRLPGSYKGACSSLGRGAFAHSAVANASLRMFLNAAGQEARKH